MTNTSHQDSIVARDRFAFDLLRLLRPDLRQLFPLTSNKNVWAWLGWMATSGASEYRQIRQNRELKRLLKQPSPQPGLSAAEWAVYLSRPDVQRHIPMHDTVGVKRWYRDHAVAEHDLHYLSDEDTGTAQESPAHLPFGVNIVGYATGELGIGEDCRMAAQTLRLCGIPYCVINFEPGIDVSKGTLNDNFNIATEPQYCINLFCLTALETGRYYLEHGDSAFEGYYNIGYWPWELRDWPKAWEPILQLADEVWVSSRHIYDAIAPVSEKPVLIMPMAVALPDISSKKRADFGLPAGHTLFCFSFDFNSSAKRKNPEGVLHAFLRAFPDPKKHSNVGLVIKSHHSLTHDSELQSLKLMIRNDPRLHLIDGTLEKKDVLALYAACDCFVSLHRAEGFGRGIAEALLLGMHVITTNYSGNLEFCSDQNCDLVRAELVAINDADYPFGNENGWSQPDLIQAAEYMLRFHQTGQRKKLNDNPFDFDRVGERYKKRLQWLARSMSTKKATTPRVAQ